MRRLGLLPALALGALVAALLAPVLVGRATFFDRDIHWVWYPWVESLVRAMAGGAWPVWDPHPGFGQPALANPAYQVAYPLAWPAWVLPGHAAYALYVFAHLLLAGTGAARLLRGWGTGRLAATAGAALWILSGPLLSFHSLHHHFAGLCFMPWVLVAVERALGEPERWGGWRLGVLLGLQLLAGSADMVVMTGLAVALRLGLLAWPAGGAPAPAPGAPRRLALGAALAAGLAAVQWLPTLALVGGTARARLGSGANLYWSLHPLSLLDLVARDVTVGPDLPAALRGVLFEGREPFVTQPYLGAAALPLVLLGCWRGRRPWGVWTGLGLLLFLVLALGRHSPLYPALAQLPPFSMLRYPVKFVAPLSLLWALAAGLGLEAARRARPRGALRLALLLLAACGLLALAGVVATRQPLVEAAAVADWCRGPVAAALLQSAAWLLAAAVLLALGARPAARPAAVLALGLLALADTGRGAREALSLAPRALASYRPAWTAAEPLRTRLHVRQPARAEAGGLTAPPPGWSPDWWWALGMQDLLAPPIGGRWGLDGSFDGDPVGLAPLTSNWMSRALHDTWGRPVALRLLQLGAVERVVSPEREDWLGAPRREVASVFARPLRVYDVPAPLPRALLVEGARVVSDEEGYQVLAREALDPRLWVLLDAGRSQAPGPDAPGRVRLVARRADRLVYEVAAQRAAWLVVQESWSAGWSAWVDGRRQPLRRANLVFRAVAVPPGGHRVEMSYRPVGALPGGIVSLLALAALALRTAARRRS